MKIVVVGLGVPFRGDDQAGVLAAQATLPNSDHFEVKILSDPCDLLDAVADADGAIIADALQCDLEPGTVVRWDVLRDPFPTITSSVHLISLEQVLDLGKSLGLLPCKLVLYGIAGKAFGLGEEVTEQVQDAAESVARSIIEEVNEWSLH
ncbi:MAG: hydrogenase maturation protease [Armatimonadetes bacterium]|nr:hydrogenase maturation protease [Armatimonadota bacterium]